MIEYDDGTTQRIASDDGWRWAPGPYTHNSIIGGADYDARLLPDGWASPGFDDRRWQPVRLIHAPTTGKTRKGYCAFLQGAVRRIPLIHDVEIWNEANSPTYWPTEPGAPAYAKLLARCYDVLHSRPFPINVISSTASRHDPAGFVLALGDAYRSLGRTAPLFDTFGHNPYPESSSEPPWALHADSDLIAEGDYGTLMNVLHTSFDDTGQPVPGQRGASIWYVEDGFQTVDYAERYAREIPETRLVRIKSAGHIPMENDPKAVAGALIEFFAAERK